MRCFKMKYIKPSAIGRMTSCTTILNIAKKKACSIDSPNKKALTGWSRLVLAKALFCAANL